MLNVKKQYQNLEEEVDDNRIVIKRLKEKLQAATLEI
jgi:hypothetical protein